MRLPLQRPHSHIGTALTRAAQRSRILILDFGSQYTQLIARRIREQRVYCEIHPPTLTAREARALGAAGLVLSGGPASVLDAGAPQADAALFELGVPVLGVCYGLQLMAHQLGGQVERAARHEYGRAQFEAVGAHPLFAGVGGSAKLSVWMSHGDRVLRLPKDFEAIGHSTGAKTATNEGAAEFAAIAHRERPLLGLQFHPEVAHSEGGAQILRNFAREICGCEGDWTVAAFVAEAVEKVREQVGEGRAVCGLSGGVDSSVAAALVHRAMGERLHCIFVDNGLLRAGERAEVQRAFGEHLGIPLHTVDAAERFLQALRGVVDPEQKRRIIGHLFIEIFEEQAQQIGGAGGADFLVQGTLYPDVIESIPVRGPSATIKTHHNVGGLPERMRLALVEPLRELFKDEVRAAGRLLGVPEAIVSRHPFPGPGLAVRVLGEVTAERLEMLRGADAILIEELRRAGLYAEIWQAFAVLLPVGSVGVMGDARSYESCVALRCVQSVDAMTADWSRLPADLLELVSSRITNEVPGVNRVVYDITSKPPATIEWE